MSAGIRNVSRPASRRGGTVAMAVVAASVVIAIFALVTSGFGRKAIAAGETLRSQRCPEGALRLTRDAPAPATTAALAEAPSAFREIDTDRTRVNAAARATQGGPRGRMVKRMCGRRVERRTVVVELLFPEMLPSASLSQGTVFVSRFADGYHIWFVAH